MIYSLVATVGMAYGAATVFRKSRREKSSDHPRFTAFTVRYMSNLVGLANAS